MKLEVNIESLLPEGGPAAAKQVFEKPVLLIGRNSTNDVVLAEPNVSGSHASLTRKTGVDGTSVLLVRDNGSSNGTYIEDQLITPKTDVILEPGKRVVIGNFILTPRVLLEKEPDEKKVVEKRTEQKLDNRATPIPSAAPSAELPSSTAELPIPDLGQANGRASNSKPEPQKKSAASEPVKKTAPEAKSTTPPPAARAKLREDELEIKRKIHDQLIERLDLRRKDIILLSDDDLRKRANEVVERILVDLRWAIPEGLNRNALVKEILDEALGLGPLEALLADNDVSEIMVNSYDMIYAEKKGKLSLTEYRFSGESAVLAAIERIIAPIGRRIDESSPLVDARLKDGSRVNAVIRPLALNGPCITIRKFSKVPITIQDLVRFNSVSQGMAEFLQLAVNHRLNTVISGGTGSGKTTLLNVISSFIPNGERVITVEDAAELRLPQEHVVSFETRPPNLEGKGAITIRDLVKNALRMRPDRIIVGECRGAEALDMLQAMNTGHDGSMTTGHANSPEDMIRRLETMVLTAGLDLPIRAVREQIASAVDIVVQQTRFGCGTRKVTAISEVVGMDYDEGTVQLQDIFLFRQSGYGTDGKIQGNHQATGYIPKFFRSLQERGLPVNASVFTPGN